MKRRDFLLLRTRDRERILELSCERLYMRYADARSGAGRAQESSEVDADPQSWDGEPPTEIMMPTTTEVFEELERELSSADVLRVLDRDWLAGGAFRQEVEVRIDAFARRGKRVEFQDSTRRSMRSAPGIRLALVACLGAATVLGACGPDVPEAPPDDVLEERVEVAIARASDVPADSITVAVSDGVVTLTGSVVCEECGGSRSTGGFLQPRSGTVQQSLGAVVRAIPGVQGVEFELRYQQPTEPPGGAGG